MKICIGAMGASLVANLEVAEKARTLGRLVAEHGAVLITGATAGYPQAAAEGAKEAGGIVIGFSPAYNEEDHQGMGLPRSAHDLIFYTGFGYKGRNLLNVRASHAILFVGGSMGTLNEFTIAYDEERIMGILQGSGGFCDHMKDWIRHLAKPGNRSVIHYDTDPARLVDLIFDSVRKEYQL